MALGTLQCLRDHVQVLAGDIGERNVFRPGSLAAARDYIAGIWQGQGYEVVYQTYSVRGQECANLEVTRRGKGSPEKILLIGAHYDTVQGSPGANDNGSGVASMLCLSDFFAKFCPEITIRFVAFVNEEHPFFFWKEMGSMVYAKAARKRNDNIVCMACLDTLGCYSDSPGSQRYPPFFKYFFPDKGDFIGFVSNFRSKKVLMRAVRAFRSHSDFPLQHVATFSYIPGIFWSDHFPFWKQGYPAFMITDTAPYRYPYYHTSGDTPDKVQFEFLAQLTDGLRRMFVILSEDLDKEAAY